MNSPVVIIGIGELGGVFAKAFLQNGHPVYPVTRSMSMTEEAENLSDPQLVLAAVAEKDFQSTMETLPDRWRRNLVLIQNELLPSDWLVHNIPHLTVISVWFEKKKGKDYHVLRPSPVYGSKAAMIAESLAMIRIPCKVLSGREELVFELVLKNVFVFTINIAGLLLEEGTTTSDLWEKHQKLAREVAKEVIDVQEFLAGRKFDREELIEGFLEGVEGDPHHICKGRAAAGRLIRMVELANEAGLKIQTIRDIRRRTSAS